MAEDATEGFKPYVAIYSTFLQRAYDQVVHDVAIQKLPVRFAIDRAGLVGSDGPTHAGSLILLSTLPNFIIMAPSSQNELINTKVSSNINDRPSAFRYPRGVGVFSDYETGNTDWQRPYNYKCDNVAILNLEQG